MVDYGQGRNKSMGIWPNSENPSRNRWTPSISPPNIRVLQGGNGISNFVQKHSLHPSTCRQSVYKAKKLYIIQPLWLGNPSFLGLIGLSGRYQHIHKHHVSIDSWLYPICCNLKSPWLFSINYGSNRSMLSMAKSSLSGWAFNNGAQQHCEQAAKAMQPEVLRLRPGTLGDWGWS